MEKFDAGHKETRIDLPDPLASSGFDRLLTSALPGMALSVASAVVMVVVMVFLVADPLRRALFVLPVPASAVAVPTAVLALLIAAGCRDRPGRLWPRYWVLMLFTWSGAIAVVALLRPRLADEPVLQALALAGLAAVLALLPRLVKIGPDSHLVQRIAILALAGVLVTILPAAGYFAHTSIGRQQDRVDRLIEQLEAWTEQIRTSTAQDWSSVTVDEAPQPNDPVKRLETLSFAGVLTDRPLWRAAEMLGRDEALTKAAWALVDEVVAGLDLQRSPKLSQLAEPAVSWDAVARRWLPSTDFPSWSAKIGDYHRHLGRLFLELQVDGLEPDSPTLSAMVAYLQKKQSELCGFLMASAQTWADYWVVYHIPEQESCVGASRPLADLLQASLIVDGDEILPPADIWKLSALSLTEMRSFDRKAPGCRNPQYPEGAYEYARLDCYAYTPRRDGPGAALRVEMRMVYKSHSGKPLQGASTPKEIYYLFPVPENSTGEAFGVEVMNGFHTAVRKVWSGELRPLDRSGAVAGGFLLIGDGREVVVHRPREVEFIDDRQAVEVLVEARG